ncbi:glycosyltransferase family 4 protein [Patescibacteria group bacterium]
MKIAIDIRETAIGKAGKGYYTFHLVQNLLNLDTQNTYILYTDNPSAVFEENDRVKIKVVSSFLSILWHKSVLKDAYKENVDIFFAPTSYIIPAIHNPKKIKVVMTVHDLVAFLLPDRHNKKAVITEKAFLKRALNKVAKVITVSDNTKEDLAEYFEIGREGIEVIYPGASSAFKNLLGTGLETVDDYRKSMHLTEPFILAVGTLEPRKNFVTLIRAFAQIVEDFPNHNLIIAGKKGWYYDEIFKAAHKLKIENKVRFLGYVSEKDLVRLYNGAEVFVYPSLYEGFGLPPLDAMQCGCPVITSNISSLPEVVGDAAVMVNPNDIDSIATEMKRVLSDENLRKQMKSKGLDQAREFSWEKSAKKLLELFNII